MKLLSMLKRLTSLQRAPSLAEEEVAGMCLPSRVLRRHSAYLYYSQRHHAQLRREA